MSKEAMKLALEVLKINLTLLKKINPYKGQEDLLSDSLGLTNKAITTLEAELAKPDFWEGYVPEPDKRQQALDKKAENARELGLDYEMPITMQEGEFDCTHAERLCAELKAAHPVTPCTHPSLGACSLREDGTASRWNCVMCGTEFVPKATNRWAEFNEATKRNMEHAEWYLSTHPQPAQQQIASTITITQRGSTRTIDNHFEDCVRDWPDGEYKLYTTPPAQQCKWPTCQSEEYQQALAEQIKRELVGDPPAQRTWVDLTFAEICECENDYLHIFARAIEAKLKEKNGG